MRDSREVAYLILTYINSMVQKDPSLFQTWLADFFVTNSDPTFCRTLKLSILTNLANDSNIDRILREFKFYATQDDKEFVAATIQCIGKCAMRLPEVSGFFFKKQIPHVQFFSSFFFCHVSGTLLPRLHCY